MKVHVLDTGQRLPRQPGLIEVGDIVVVGIQQVEYVEPIFGNSRAVCDSGVHEQGIVGAHRVVFDERCFSEPAEPRAGAQSVAPAALSPSVKVLRRRREFPCRRLGRPTSASTCSTASLQAGSSVIVAPRTSLE